MIKTNRKISYIEDKFPLALVTEDGLTITKGGQVAAVIELRGRDYTGMDIEVIDSLFMGRKRFFESLPTEITLLHQSHRLRISQELETESFSIPIAKKIADQWARNFTDTYRTRHFLIFVTATDNIEDQIMLAAAKRTAAGIPVHLLQILKDSVEDTLSKLQAYSPRLLQSHDLASYWAWLVNGMHVHQRCPNSGRLEGILAETILAWPKGRPYQIYRGARERLSAWLIIQAPPSETRARLMDTLFSSRHQFSLYQTFSRYEKNNALDAAEDRLKNAQSFGRASGISVMECEELMARLSADEIALLRHRWALEVFGDDEAGLEVAVTEIRNVVGSFGIRCAREWVNQEACFWARFPELQNYQSRVRSMTSENAPHFASFPTVGEGLDRCSWGPWPVTLFKTSNLAEYSFTFHHATGQNALGNTMVIGGSEAGKTTLISFLETHCFKYDNFRACNFDRLNGLEVFASFFDGIYIGTKQLTNLEINPCQLNDTVENRAFLSQWFITLTGKDSDDDKERISNAIKQLYTAPKDKRCLKEIQIAFGLQEANTIARSLTRWLPGGEYGAFFNGKRNALDFDNPLVCFDMTTLLDLPEVLAPFVQIIFHMLFLTAKEKGGYIVFIDELPKYLKNDHFTPKIESILQEIRKTDGVFIGACQDAPTILDHPIAPRFLNNIATWMLFPEPKALAEHYKDILGLNDKEFTWIKTTDPFSRQVLVKKKGGESVVLSVDLKPLGKYLKIYDSGADAVQKVEDYRRRYGQDWKRHYLHG